MTSLNLRSSRIWDLIWHKAVNALLTGIFTPFFRLTGTVIGFF